jgi:subtilase family serine protease
MKLIRSLAFVSALAGLGLAAAASAAPKPVVQHSKHGFNIAACPAVVSGGARCHAHVVTDANGAPLRLNAVGGGRFAPVTPNAGFNPVFPAQVRAAYGINGFGSSSTTVAIVDAFGYPNAEADLNTFRSAVGLGPCTTASGCLTIVNQGGGKDVNIPSDVGWDIEQAADLDTVTTMCPNCKIILVEAHSARLNDLAAAVRTAAAMGAHVISNSYGGGEIGTQPFEGAYNQPGIAVTASTGDAGFGVQFPASSPHVTAVGGTSLTMNGFARVSETAWDGAGSGCSTVYPGPSWQASSNANMANNTLCSMRMAADVSADADPDTGVVIYINIPPIPAGFYGIGGTSISNQIIAGIYGERGDAVNYASKIYANSSTLNDIISGSNGSCSGLYLCTAMPGYDGPTGLGTPSSDVPF